MDERRQGYLYGLAAFALWGFFPLYFRALRPAGAVEILAHRVIWSAVAVAALLLAVRGWRRVWSLRHRPGTLAALAVAAVLIGGNWGLYLYGVQAGEVVQTSLGYFVTPLVAVVFGLTVFAERLRRLQWVALATGTLAVLVLTLDYRHPPWIALGLALSFGSYTMIKKWLGLPPADGLLLESAVLAPAALVYLVVLAGHGRSTFGTGPAWHTVLLVLSGVATAAPLLLFAAAANRLPLSTVGLMQYLTPVLQLLTGVFLFHEPMPPARLAGFALVWLALAVFSWDALRTAGAAGRAGTAGTAGRPNIAGTAGTAGPVSWPGGTRAAAGGGRRSGVDVAQDDRLVALVYLDRGDVGRRQ